MNTSSSIHMHPRASASSLFLTSRLLEQNMEQIVVDESK